MFPSSFTYSLQTSKSSISSPTTNHKNSTKQNQYSHFSHFQELNSICSTILYQISLKCFTLMFLLNFAHSHILTKTIYDLSFQSAKIYYSQMSQLLIGDYFFAGRLILRGLVWSLCRCQVAFWSLSLIDLIFSLQQFSFTSNQLFQSYSSSAPNHFKLKYQKSFSLSPCSFCQNSNSS